MGEWKAQISVRVRQDLRREIEHFAAKEHRKLGNLGEVMLEWAFEQLKMAGSVDRLLKYQLGKRKESLEAAKKGKATVHESQEQKRSER